MKKENSNNKIIKNNTLKMKKSAGKTDITSTEKTNTIPTKKTTIKPEALLNMMEDLEEAKEKLEEEKKFSETILKTIPEGMDIVDQKLQILWMSDNFLKIFGQKAIGKKCFEVYRDNKTQCQKCPLKKSIKVGETKTLITDHVAGGKTFEITHTGMIYKDKKAILETFRDITENKKVANRIRESEMRFRLFFENDPDFCYMISTDGKILGANHAALNFLGYSVNELTGKPLKGIYAPESLPRMKKLFIKWKKEGKLFNEEIVIINKKQERKTVLLSANSVRDTKGKVIHSISVQRDITEKKKAEEKIKESDEKYRTLFEKMDEGFCVIEMIYNAKSKPVDYRFLEINAAFMKQTGLKDALTKTMRQMVPKHDEHWFKIYGDVAKTGKSIRFQDEAKVMQRYYDVFAFRLGGKGSKKVGVIFNDISVKKKAENQTKLQNEIFKNLAEGVYLIDLKDFKIKWANEKFEQMFGYKPGEMIGKDVARVNAPVHGMTPKQVRDAIVKLLRKDKEWHGEVENIRKNGTHFWCYADVSIFNHLQWGEVIVSAHTDVTERNLFVENIHTEKNKYQKEIIKLKAEIEKLKKKKTIKK